MKQKIFRTKQTLKRVCECWARNACAAYEENDEKGLNINESDGDSGSVLSGSRLRAILGDTACAERERRAHDDSTKSKRRGRKVDSISLARETLIDRILFLF